MACECWIYRCNRWIVLHCCCCKWKYWKMIYLFHPWFTKTVGRSRDNFKAKKWRISLHCNHQCKWSHLREALSLFIIFRSVILTSIQLKMVSTKLDHRQRFTHGSNKYWVVMRMRMRGSKQCEWCKQKGKYTQQIYWFLLLVLLVFRWQSSPISFSRLLSVQDKSRYGYEHDFIISDFWMIHILSQDKQSSNCKAQEDGINKKPIQREFRHQMSMIQQEGSPRTKKIFIRNKEDIYEKRAWCKLH